ncbi:MAG: 8-amino-7-oxononanoate synthase [Candidatus Omnitrophota bacterium]
MGRVDNFLEERKEKGLLRALRPAGSRDEGRIRFSGRDLIDFSSNDYLGLSSHPALREASIRAVEQFGTGSGAARLLSGDLKLHHELEEKTARFKAREAALVFNSGYQANVSVIPTLAGRGDAVFSDRLNHASILDGIRLSGAKMFRFDHNDADHLEFLLKTERGKFKEALIVSETVFSMDGDMAPLAALVHLKERYACAFLTDEAHATGIYGDNGSGMVEEAGLTGKVDLVMGTFSKALGSFGAYIACTTQMKEYLINACGGFIYSTALPPSVIAANIASLEVVRSEPFRRTTLLENAKYFRDGLSDRGLPVRGNSPIVPLIVGDNARAVELSRTLEKRGYRVPPIRPPTVPIEESRLRFTITYYHSKDILERLLHDLVEIC